MRCGIIFDVDGWCIAEHATALAKYAPIGLKVEARAMADADVKWLASLDTCYWLYLGGISSVAPSKRNVASVGSHCWMHKAFDPKNWRTRGVNRTRNHPRGATLLSRIDAVTCRNQALGAWAKPLCKSVGVFPGGIDPDIYHPVKRPHNEKMRVGFCGQVSGNPDADFKGADLFEQLAQRLGDRYEFVANTRTHANRLSQFAMVDWFQHLDIFLCLSCADCTPIPPFQAAACGATVISTKVGQLADWNDLNQLGLVVPDYGNAAEAEIVIDAMADRLSRLEDYQYRRAMSETLLESIEREYSYRVLAPKTLSFVCGVDL